MIWEHHLLALSPSHGLLIVYTMASLFRSARIARPALTAARGLHSSAVARDHFLNANVEVGDKPADGNRGGPVTLSIHAVSASGATAMV